MRRSKRPHRRTSSATGCMMHQALKLAREASGMSVAQLQAHLPGDVALIESGDKLILVHDIEAYGTLCKVDPAMLVHLSEVLRAPCKATLPPHAPQWMRTNLQLQNR